MSHTRPYSLGEKSWFKITERRKLLSGFGYKLLQNPLKHPEENAHLERSHRAGDDEVYIPRTLKEAFHFLYHYNAVRKHSRLRKLEPHLDARITYVPPLILDNPSAILSPWSE